MSGIGGRSANQGEEYRVLGCFSRRPSWDPHTPSPAGESVPPFWFQGGHNRLRKRGGGPNADDWSGQTLWCTRCKCTLWGGGKQEMEEA
jgi:hypothetical protein